VASKTDRTLVRVDVELSSKHRSEEIDPAAIERIMSAFVSESRSMPRWRSTLRATEPPWPTLDGTAFDFE
jgi:hypothetical protein